MYTRITHALVSCSANLVQFFYPERLAASYYPHLLNGLPNQKALAPVSAQKDKAMVDAIHARIRLLPSIARAGKMP